jgi:glycosyltransferase involved in cell wall biosynthesis
MSASSPLVSILTPVFNGEPYVAQCIESVLAQTYTNWEYLIVNNCSTDKTESIADGYAKRDRRVKVVTNEHFVGVIENHNIAFRLMSSDSKYCKVVSADDWIYPECVRYMVDVAEQSSSIGIVGSYAIKTSGVRGTGLPLRSVHFTGREVCRLRLLGEDVIGSPSSLLYRADLIRSEKEFLKGKAPNADTDACFRVLQHLDFGFVHQILSFERVHDEAVSSKLMKFNPFLLDQLEFLAKYGAAYLSREECENRKGELLTTLYRDLARAVVHRRDREFWRYQRDRLDSIGVGFHYGRLIQATMYRLLALGLNPLATIEQFLSRRTRDRKG